MDVRENCNAHALFATTFQAGVTKRPAQRINSVVTGDPVNVSVPFAAHPAPADGHQTAPDMPIGAQQDNTKSAPD
jgi:hypothetical protein